MAEIDRLLYGTMQMKGSDLHLSSEQSARVRDRMADMAEPDPANAIEPSADPGIGAWGDIFAWPLIGI